MHRRVTISGALTQTKGALGEKKQNALYIPEYVMQQACVNSRPCATNHWLGFCDVIVVKRYHERQPFVAIREKCIREPHAGAILRHIEQTFVPVPVKVYIFK